MDRDGTISKSLGFGVYLKNWESFEFREDTVAAMVELATDGFSFIVITNQAGIGRGVVSQDDVDLIHQRMSAELADRGISILDTYCCADRPDSKSEMRKPAPGMFFRAERDHGFLLEDVLYVGDDFRDCEAAAAAGCGMILLADDPEESSVPRNPRLGLVRSTLGDALPEIRRYYDLETRA